MAKVTAGNILRYQRVSFVFPVILILDENHSKAHMRVSDHIYSREYIDSTLVSLILTLALSYLVQCLIQTQVYRPMLCRN